MGDYDFPRVVLGDLPNSSVATAEARTKIILHGNSQIGSSWDACNHELGNWSNLIGDNSTCVEHLISNLDPKPQHL